MTLLRLGDIGDDLAGRRRRRAPRRARRCGRKSGSCPCRRPAPRRLDHTPSAPTSRRPVVSTTLPSRSIETVTPSACKAKSRTAEPVTILISGYPRGARDQRAVQVGAVRHEIGRAPALLREIAELYARQHGEAARVAQRDAIGTNGRAGQRLGDAEFPQQPHRVGRKLQPGAGLVEVLRRAHGPAPKSRAARRPAPPSARQCRRRR